MGAVCGPIACTLALRYRNKAVVWECEVRWTCWPRNVNRFLKLNLLEIFAKIEIRNFSFPLGHRSFLSKQKSSNNLTHFWWLHGKKRWRYKALGKGKCKAIPLQVSWAPGGRCSQILRHLTHEGFKVLSPRHRPPLPPGNTPGTLFC